MSTKYQLLFSPELREDSSDILLVPVIVAEDGDRFAMQKMVKTVKQALLFNAGFTLAQFIEDEGGFEGVKAILEARDEEARQANLDLDDEPVAPTVEDGLLEADEGC